MDRIAISLAARDPARNIHRAWSITASPDLFGVWVIETGYGRIGCPGRIIARSVPSEAAAYAHVARALRRRASAPRRLGVSYIRT